MKHLDNNEGGYTVAGLIEVLQRLPQDAFVVIGERRVRRLHRADVENIYHDEHTKEVVVSARPLLPMSSPLQYGG